MHRFFVTPEQVSEKRILISGRDVNHIKNVLRMGLGDRVSVCDGNNLRYLCEIAGFGSDGISLKIIEKQAPDTELSSKIYLFQGLPKGDKMDLIVQKAVELGASGIIPVEMKRSVVRLDGKKPEKKLIRWNAIAESAAKQAGRSFIPEVTRVMSFDEAVSYAGKLDILLLPYELAEGMEETRNIIRGIIPGQSVGVFIGPEGGFETPEVEKAIESGAKIISLGKRILRTETAGLAMLSVLVYHLE